MDNSAIAWDCVVCDCPNYSSICFDLILSTSNHFSLLSDATFQSPSSVNKVRPVHASTPIGNSSTNAKAKSLPLKILNINCQSIKSKQCRLKHLLKSTKPDIGICTETWINPSITGRQVFPTNYKLYRNDSKTTGGGVLVAINSDHLSTPVPELQTECEIVWAKISTVNSKDLYIAAYYNPKASNVKAIDELGISLSRACSNKHANIVVADDFNLPGWN
jgi:hypothetical protein